MTIITLTTDWGIQDYHAGKFKGLLFSGIPECQVIDITHFIPPWNLVQAAYNLPAAWRSFPAGTIHFIGVGSYSENKSELLLAKKDGHYFICLNDGFLSLLFEEPPADLVQLKQSSRIFSAIDIESVCQAMEAVAMGTNIYEIGTRPENYHQLKLLRPVIDEDTIRGSVVYFDDFGNAITNIERSLFEISAKGRKFVIVVKNQKNTIHEISRHYFDVEKGQTLAIFNEFELLEIAVNQSSAHQLLGIKTGDQIRIDFQ